MAQPLTHELVEWADQIAIMSPEHADFIKINYPEGIDKVVELVKFKFGGKPQDTTKDPYGMKLFHYRQYFGELMEALQGYYAQLNGTPS